MLDDIDPEAASTNRSNLEMAVAENGSERDAYRVAHELAAPTLVATPTTDAVNSKVGGPPLLPAGASWPRDRQDIPLSFIAAIDLSELPSDVESPAIARDGWLVLYARLDTDEYIDPDDSLTQLLRSTTAPELADPAIAGIEGPPTTPETAIAWESHLTLPDFEGTKIPADGQEAYEDTLAVLDELRPFGYPQLLLGGYAPNAQGERTNPGHHLILSIGTDIDDTLVLANRGTTQYFAPTALGSNWEPDDLIAHTDY